MNNQGPSNLSQGIQAADYNLIITLVRYGLFAVIVLVASITIVSVVAYWRGDPDALKALRGMLSPVAAMQTFTIGLIICAAGVLSILRIIEGTAVVAILSSIAGYVLGSVEKNRQPQETKESDSGEPG